MHFLSHAAIIVAFAYTVGREKLFHREADTAEKRAGIVFGNAAGTFFFGQAVIIGWYKQLSIPLKSDY